MGSSGLLLQPHFLFFVEMTFPANQALGQRQEKVRALWNRWFIRSFPDGTDVLWVPPRYQASCQPLGTDMVPALLVLVAQIDQFPRETDRSGLLRTEKLLPKRGRDRSKDFFSCLGFPAARCWHTQKKSQNTV